MPARVRPAGLLSLPELRRLAARGAVDTVIVGFTDHYGRLVGKRYDAGFFLDQARAGGEACNYLLTVDMEMEPVAGYAVASWEAGYGDFHLAPDLATLRTAAWLERTALVLCDLQQHGPGHEPVAPAPRTVLRRQVDRAAKAGYTVMAASELEYYLFDTSYRAAAAAGYAGLTPAGWYLEDYHVLQGSRTEGFHAAARRALAASGVPVETSKGEWGRGQHELNVRYAEALEMADRHVVFKQCLKELADRQGRSLTFMAKPFTGQAGSSCHVHLSLWRGDRNVFAGRRGAATFGRFIAGLLTHLPVLMPLLAPTVNSYKRYQSGSWAPTRLAWSRDNRTAALRVLGEGEGTRVECRLPGADCNPYLAYAALLAAGLDGIERRLEPPPEFRGDLYVAQDLPSVPATLREAADAFAASRFARTVFGEPVHHHYAHFFRREQAAYDAAVTDWERQRYFERI